MTTSSGPAIFASKVKGTSVYNTQHESIGKVEDVVLDKRSDSILFAVVSFGGFLGIGEKYHSVPWAYLDYDEKAGGYVIPMSKEDLKAAPVHDLDEFARGDLNAMRKKSYDYYKVPATW